MWTGPPLMPEIISSCYTFYTMIGWNHSETMSKIINNNNNSHTNISSTVFPLICSTKFKDHLPSDMSNWHAWVRKKVTLYWRRWTYNKNGLLWAGKIAWSAMCLLCKHKDLSSTHRTTLKNKPLWPQYLGGVDPWGSVPASLAYLVFSRAVRDPVSTKRQTESE